MSDQDKWNDKYAKRLHNGKSPAPNPVLTDQIPVVSKGTALDIACGLGANALMLADRGYHVHAFDISDTAVSHLQSKADAQKLPVSARTLDLTSMEGQAAMTAAAPLDLIVITYYLDRDLFSFIGDLITPGGYLFIETYVSMPGMTDTPVKEEYKLHPAELVDTFEDWGIMYFDFDEENGIQTILLRKKTTHN
ncbi:class I SAM-dependent methyltransferase [Salisediminibacterium beveridgei]|uniref:Tellurite resistance protein TehB n=1 Tax=Salisediminibacterium beveridgei TaxID=632773 RepID=A0A1D7QZX0_9BACI|nr:methyltransferase domain-containing protein [Salisediminibacterium beveridgei]AOM84510.1 Tellurite resistance protein TehB [Salisediminibacterium beveridgei]